MTTAKAADATSVVHQWDSSGSSVTTGGLRLVSNPGVVSLERFSLKLVYDKLKWHDVGAFVAIFSEAYSTTLLYEILQIWASTLENQTFLTLEMKSRSCDPKILPQQIRYSQDFASSEKVNQDLASHLE